MAEVWVEEEDTNMLMGTHGDVEEMAFDRGRP
jgi:hypothetical protein